MAVANSGRKNDCFNSAMITSSNGRLTGQQMEFSAASTRLPLRCGRRGWRRRGRNQAWRVRLGAHRPAANESCDDFHALAYETMNATIMAMIASVREIPSTQRTTPVVRPCRTSVAVFTGGSRPDIARYSSAAMSASPLSASFRLCRCRGDSVSTTSSVGRTCAFRRWPPIAMPSARLTTT